MPCYRPITAYSVPGAAISFNPASGGRKIQVSCGSCIGCRWTRQQDWATRCMHEAQTHHGQGSFITLTLEKPQLSLDYTQFQAFIRRARRELKKPLRYFCAGEYGELNARPHYHALIFGHCFDRQRPVTQGAYTSHELQKLWPLGFSSTGDITAASARYCASYTLKKKTGPMARQAYSRIDLATGEIREVEPEFAHMSLKPAIGHDWIRKYWREVYGPRDGVIQPGGRINKPPRYYDKILERITEEEASSSSSQHQQHEEKTAHPLDSPRALKSASERWREIQNRRIENRKARRQDNTETRLKIREKIKTEEIKFKKRKAL